MLVSRVKVDDQVAEALGAHPETVELVDAEGHVLGTFTPSKERRAEVYRQLNALISDEELAQRAKETSGCTTAELLDKLSKL
jgi:hypothetical protein